MERDAFERQVSDFGFNDPQMDFRAAQTSYNFRNNPDAFSDSLTNGGSPTHLYNLLRHAFATEDHELMTTILAVAKLKYKDLSDLLRLTRDSTRRRKIVSEIQDYGHVIDMIAEARQKATAPTEPKLQSEE